MEFSMKIIIGVLAIFVFAGCQIHNDSSQDDVIYSGGDIESQARRVLATSCTPCHSFYQDTKIQLIANDIIVEGDPESSELILRLRGSALGGSEDMPPTGAIALKDIQILKDWITSL
jgi:hypothetical protein